MMMMKLAALALASLAVASPLVTKRADPSEVDILQYALTLEHLEAAYYKTYLSKFDAAAFTKAGFPSFLRGRFNQISMHETEHVTFISTALNAAGVTPTAACEYKFPVTDVKSFVAVAEILEGVGVTAYLGAAQFLKTPGYLTAAGAILTTEARHNAWINSVGLKGAPWSGAFDSPQTLNEVYSLAAPFIVSCPKSNPTLPVKAFPALTATVSSNTKATLTYPGSQKSGQFLALLSGLNTVFVPISNGAATLPSGLQGTVYAVVSSDGKSVSDASTVAGPAILKFPFDSSAKN